MKKIILLGTVVVTILASLGGCIWVEPRHDRHDRYEHDRYEHDRHYYDMRYHDREGGYYERR